MSERGTHHLCCQEAVRYGLIMINNVHIPEKMFFSLSCADFLKMPLLNIISGADTVIALEMD